VAAIALDVIVKVAYLPEHPITTGSRVVQSQMGRPVLWLLKDPSYTASLMMNRHAAINIYQNAAVVIGAYSHEVPRQAF